MSSVEGEVHGQEADELIAKSIQVRVGEWVALYLDPDTGRLWRLDYPSGHLQGGGLPRMSPITLADAEAEFGLRQEEMARELDAAERSRREAEQGRPFGSQKVVLQDDAGLMSSEPRYFRAQGEPMSREFMDQYFEVDGERVLRQVTHFRDLWLSSLDDWFEPVGMLLTDQPVPSGDIPPGSEITQEEFERVWQLALEQRRRDDEKGSTQHEYRARERLRGEEEVRGSIPLSGSSVHPVMTG